MIVFWLWTVGNGVPCTSDGEAEIFPALPPVDAEGAENRLWNLRAFACTTSLDPLQEESDAATGSQDSSLCALLAASTGIPSWTMRATIQTVNLCGFWVKGCF
ncbi:hypothetical protein AK812_SmicGene46087 [Symbiodinium microadriaticum]|uniref:Uncharacterized protein n=1 Tax=Symbiodinium microadriaticum TaxID=2951 RepID=A0A1Q9BUP6_SYMMI|nr:hypothetical protein AK812_SmicGene46087 [Symbiodinium microadriaticum]